MSLQKKIVLISGSTRGIGLNIAEKLSDLGHTAIITGKKMDSPNPKNLKYIPLNLRNPEDIENCRRNIVEEYGKIDVLINNASAMWWLPIGQTPKSKYDLVNEVNVRGTYLLSREFIPYLREGGTIITHSPPIDDKSMKVYLKYGIKNKIAYMVSKLGMSIVASGLAQELRDKKISSNCIWPSTAIETAAMKDNNLIPPQFNNPKLWRKPDIIADMVIELINEDHNFTNNFLIDELYLRSKGYTDFTKYQSSPGHEPPKLDKLFSME